MLLTGERLFAPTEVLAQDEQVKSDPALEARYKRISKAVDGARITKTMRILSDPAFGSRVVGYPGSERAAKYVLNELKKTGIKDITVEKFVASIPMDKGASIQVRGKKYRIYPLWPNMVRTPALGPEGITGPVSYVGACRLQDMTNKPIKGGLVLTDFNCGTNWINAIRTGAKAVLFTHTDRALRGEAEAKFLSIPMDVPRYWVPKDALSVVKAAAASGESAKITCDMPWERVTGRNILAKIEGSDPALKKQVVILSAYFDSTSVIPTLAPGAESAAGIAGLLEIARVLQKYPPKRTVWILAADGHYQGLAGVRQWLDKHIDSFSQPSLGEKISGWFGSGKKRDKTDVYLFCGLDLSTHNEGVGLFYKGYFYDFREDLKSRFSDIATVARDNSEMIARAQGRDKDLAFADCVNDIGGKNWRNYIPGKIAYDSEPFSMAGGVGITFGTLNDSRPLVDTPSDTFDRTEPENVTKQVRVIACILDHFLRAPTQTGRLNFKQFPVREPNKFQRIGIQGGFSRVGGQVVLYDPKKGFVPNQPVGDAIAILRNASKAFMGVRANLVELTDGKGFFSFPGAAPVTAYQGPRPTSLAAYKLDPKTGGIIFAPDQGATGGEFNYNGFDVATSSKQMPVVVFQCVATNIYDLVDPQSLRALGGLTILDGTTNGTPRTYGSSVAAPEPMVSHVEDGAVIFTPPNSRIKLLMSAGPAAMRLILLNNTAKDHEGIGYDVGNGTTITNTAYKAARDMWILDDYRIQRLAKYRIINQGLNKLHRQAAEELKKAESALARRDYEAFEAYSRSAWGFEARAYPDVQATATDVVKGSLFYMALLLPFAFFLERLFFGFANLNKQLTTFCIIFILVAVGLSQIHPAFDITLNPIIVILAFVMLVLSGLVIVLVSGKFEEQLRALNKQVSGVHRVDIGRISVASAAFSLGVSNMRRRKARTVLTCVSLILVTFIVLSFTSIVNEIKFNARPTANKPNYNGIMLRTAMWEPLQQPAYRVLSDEFARKKPVAPRGWFFGAALGEQSSLTVKNKDKRFEAKAAIGLSPEEDQVTGIKKVLVAGRWFNKGDVYSAILPERMVNQLGIAKEQVGKVQVMFAGVPYTLIGIFSSPKMRDLKDLDGEPLTPVDFILMSKQSGQAQSMGEAGFREYQHMDPDTTFIVPYKTLVNMGGDLRSIGINFVGIDEVKGTLQKLMPRLGLNLYAGIGDTIYRYSSIGGQSGKGFGAIIIPIIIAAMSVLKTMLDSVFERHREIGIFSSIGLAPNHIAILFFAEATVYGILGAVSGYLIGQGVSKFLAETGYLAGLTLNFSSTSAVMSTMLVMIIVWLSTLYPARKASEVATPAIDRSWKVPDPEGDVWRIPLPFSVTGEQAEGVNIFLKEWFMAYEEYSVGDFVTQDVVTEEFQHQYGKAYALNCRAWLAPFDLGVSQLVRLETIPTDYEDVFEIFVILTRQSGDISNWRRVNRRFLNTLRKQFLIWRTLRHDERERYLAAPGQTPAGEVA